MKTSVFVVFMALCVFSARSEDEAKGVVQIGEAAKKVEDAPVVVQKEAVPVVKAPEVKPALESVKVENVEKEKEEPKKEAVEPVKAVPVKKPEVSSHKDTVKTVEVKDTKHSLTSFMSSSSSITSNLVLIALSVILFIKLF